ncbi:MAG: methyl-accepting chemotaxis protein [Rubrivivax sp.]
MNRLNQLSIGARLGSAFVLLVAIVIAVAAIARFRTAAVDDDVHRLVNDNYVKVSLVADIAEGLAEQGMAARDALLVDDPARREAALQAMDASRAKYAAVYDKLGAMPDDDEGMKLLAQLKAARAEYVQQAEAFTRLARGADVALARAHLTEKLMPRQQAYRRALETYTKEQESEMQATIRETERETRLTYIVLLAAAMVGVLLAVVGGVWATRSITRPMAEVVRSLEAVAAGDLTTQVRVDRGDELGQLQKALSHTVESLRRVVDEVRTGVDSVNTASSQIAAGNQDLSGRTEQQAGSLQQTASSMEQLTGTVRQSADNAQAASQLASAASSAAGRGGEVVTQVVATMEDISSSSRKIADIIGVIDGIAFQTNILALNAAVEAARAGEQGRGFAVVAGEVRNLAQRSATAAREIKSLIGSSVEKVEVGSRQAAEAGQAMEEIVVKVRRVTDLIGEIASAANEQSSGIGQVNQAVAHMDQITQQNAALVEESAAAARSLAEQASRLAEVVSVFRLLGSVQPAPAVAVAARAPDGLARPRLAAAPAGGSDWQSF